MFGFGKKCPVCGMKVDENSFKSEGRIFCSEGCALEYKKGTKKSNCVSRERWENIFNNRTCKKNYITKNIFILGYKRKQNIKILLKNHKETARPAVSF